MKQCNKCGAYVADDMKFCMECGNTLDNQPIQNPSNQYTTHTSQPKNNNKKLIIIIASLAVAVAAIIITVVLLVSNKNNNQTNNQTLLNSQQPTSASNELIQKSSPDSVSISSSQTSSAQQSQSSTQATVAKTPVELNNVLATASSALFENNSPYMASNLLDGDIKTPWVEDGAGDGIGEYVEFKVPKGTIITGVDVVPGFYKRDELFYENAVPTVLDFNIGGNTFSKDLSAKANQSNESDPWVKLSIENSEATDGTVRMTIKDTRHGSKYEDTCIGEVKLYGILPDSYLEKKNNIDQYYSGTNAEKITVTMTNSGLTQSYSTAHIKAVNNVTSNVEWEYNTDYFVRAQYDKCSNLFRLGDLFFYHYNDKIICIDVTSGDIMWISSENLSHRSSNYVGIYNPYSSKLYIANNNSIFKYDLYGNKIDTNNYNTSSIADVPKSLECTETQVILTMLNNQKYYFDSNSLQFR